MCRAEWRIGSRALPEFGFQSVADLERQSFSTLKKEGNGIFRGRLSLILKLEDCGCLKNFQQESFFYLLRSRLKKAGVLIEKDPAIILKGIPSTAVSRPKRERIGGDYTLSPTRRYKMGKNRFIYIRRP